MQTVEGVQDEVMCTSTKIRLDFYNFSVKNKLRPASFCSSSCRDLDGFTWSQRGVVYPVQSRIIQHESGDIRHVQAVFDVKLKQVSHELFGCVVAVDLHVKLADKCAYFRHWVSLTSYRV